MRVKTRFELIYKSTGDVFNIVPLSKNTLKVYEIDKIDFNHLIGLVRTFSRIKRHPLSHIIEDYAKSCLVVKLDAYPLPGFITDRGVAVVNLSALPTQTLSDYTASDIFSMFLYTIALKTYITKKPFVTAGMEINIANMIFSIFMKLFGKKSGLIGAFRGLIPKLQFIITLYVSVAMMGFSQNDSLMKKIGSSLFIDPAELKLDYDFNSTIEFLKAINENQIIPLSEFKFSSSIISAAGLYSLPMFEDISRFFATILACEIPGNSLFSTFWIKSNTTLYQKLNQIGVNAILKGIS